MQVHFTTALHITIKFHEAEWEIYAVPTTVQRSHTWISVERDSQEDEESEDNDCPLYYCMDVI